MSRYFSSVLYILLLLVTCVAFLAIAGVRVGIFEPLTGFSMLRNSVWAALFLSFLAVLAMVLCRREHNLASQRFSMAVLLVSLSYSLGWIGFYFDKAALPNINDITTDTDNPPAYINVNFLRRSSENSLTYNHEWAAIQAKYYPRVQPLVVNQDREQVYQQAVQLVRDLGWDMVAQYPGAGVIEATARTPVFGFRDDVIIRVKEVDGSIRIDMRSSSRVGHGDYGENATRIVNYLSQLSQRLKRSPTLNYRN
ncbi:DUF1499 domain-containing protein [Maribrevibacterium harenarium]|uniref:DUF1499 domain-containing protein n=1 Tax=Maribrevibacterium harenarium TaxID=2589817 RepID=A0A501WME8_9GAMM|nr:DUF1499 domain-containing protein [Maribrevibacterium harenarium]TPE48447.1 DUF1499 domain-containing protein [Maribrevibacterium harenarium]